MIIDTESKTLSIEDGDGCSKHSLKSKQAFELLSRQWLKVGWNEKYPYPFSWMGRPIIQLPEDMIRMQEVIYRVRPNLIIETGVAHGGSLVFYASILKAMGIQDPRVIGVDIEIRPHNRTALESHELFPYITLVEGGSTTPEVVGQVTEEVMTGDNVLVILDSNHTRAHVAAELEAYSDLVSVGSYIVATDGSMRDLHDVPRGAPHWQHDHPAAAAEEFALENPTFVLEQPEWPFNESKLEHNVTHWPNAYLRRV